MARPSDIEDATFRAAMAEAEKLIDAGDYTKASRKCAETYLLLLDRRPDLIPPPGAGGFGGFGGFGGAGGGPGAGAASLGAGFGAGRAMRRAFWPGEGGIRVVIDADRGPSLSFEKNRFSFSEAATYFEFMVDQLVQAQREPA